MKSINDIQEEILEKYSKLIDWMDVYQELIQLGIATEKLDSQYKQDCNLIDGCQNKVWVAADNNDGIITYHFDSDATVVRGIVALILSVLSGHTAKEIVESDLYFIEKIGLKDQLSYNRGNGLRLIIERIYDIAKSYT